MFRRYIAAVTVSLGVVSIGTSIGWMSPAVEKLPNIVDITSGQLGWLSSAHEIGRIIFAVLGLLDFSSENLSPTWSLTAASLLVVLNWILIAFTANVPVLFLARLLVGLSMGVVYTAVPLYICEVAPPKSRGALSTLFQATLYTGHEIAYLIGLYLNYYLVAYISCGIALVWTLTTFLIVESPTFLVRTKQWKRARKAIARLDGGNDEDAIEEHLAQIQEEMDKSQLQTKGTFRDLFVTPNRSKVGILCGVAVAQRLSGMAPVVNYAAETFPSTDGGLTSNDYTLIFGAIVPISTVFATTLIDWLGRRPLLIASCVGAFIAHLVTAIAFGLLESVTWLPVCSITAFAVFYAVGLGPIMNALQGELPPPHLKWAASSLMTALHAAASILASKLFQVFADEVGYSLDFGLFALFCAISAILAYFIVPETKHNSDE